MIINKLESIISQEKSIIFSEFNEKTALKLGLKIIENANNLGGVSIQIKKNDLLMFYYAMENTAIDNETWCQRKANVVKRFNHSSLYMKEKYLQRNCQFNEYLHLNPNIYQAKGGGIPLIVKNCGVVGTIAVSGLTEEKDHELVIKSIIEIIKEEK